MRRHIPAATQVRLDTSTAAYYRHKLTEDKTRMEAMRCLKRRISDAGYHHLLADEQQTPSEATAEAAGAGPGGHCGASKESVAEMPRTYAAGVGIPNP